jgi:hypothetical protein
MMEGSDGRTSPVEPGGVKSQRDGELQALLARVEAATGPDRHIDFWLSVLVSSPDPSDDFEKLRADIANVSIEEMAVDGNFTASLDAALALVERVLPGWFKGLQESRNRSDAMRWAAYITPPKPADHEFEAYASAPALALLAALLKTLSRQPPRAPQEPGDKAREAK